MVTLKQLQRKAQKAVDLWNSKYPVGQPVSLLKDGGDIVETKTKSEATVMSCTAVIWLEGISGCYALERCTAI